ncbi:MAG: glycosyltransferase family 39 protein [Phycisphaerae bacterium]|nr:glycosyltransferase family 39 protein [Phycisphaerae bacterium]
MVEFGSLDTSRANTAVMPSSPSAWLMTRFSAWMGLCAAIALLWTSALDHPLYPSDEGRYGSIAARMAESGDWLVPQFRGQAHLTKPPLTYWLQGIGVLAFGRTELAVRLPSLLASTVVLIVIFTSVGRIRGRTAATCAAMLYGILPLGLAFGRLGSTDAILNCWWTIALVAGYRAVTERSRAAAAIFWIAIALAALTKGPLALGPIGIVVFWRLLAGDVGSLRWLRPAWGVPLAIMPLATWAIAITANEPALLTTWWNESIGRATGDLGKRDVWWYFVPIFLAGMFPASAMLTLPGFNLSWRAAWQRTRDGSFESLCVVGVVLPLLVFSVAEGKLPSYILPVGPSLAMLVGVMLATRWMADDAASQRAPDVRITVLIVCIVVAIAIPLAFDRFELPSELRAASFLFILPAVAVGWLALVWRNLPQRRRAFALAWAGFAAAWLVALQVENVLLERESPQQLARALSRIAGDESDVFVVGNSDPTRGFYRRGVVRDLGGNVAECTVREASWTTSVAIFTDDQWPAYLRDHPRNATFVEPLFYGSSFYRRPYVICRVRRMPEQP